MSISKCFQADVSSNSLVNEADVVLATSLPPSGSSQQWLKYLYCTPGTQTYTFFNFGELNPAPGTGTQIPGYRDVYGAFDQAAAAVDSLVANDGPIANGNWTLQSPDTNIEIGAISHVGTLTYGILKSALVGLTDVSANYNQDNNPVLFQINDGSWGEVGIGYAGYKNDVGQCIYMENSTANYACRDAMNGHAGGLD